MPAPALDSQAHEDMNKGQNSMSLISTAKCCSIFNLTFPPLCIYSNYIFLKEYIIWIFLNNFYII